MGRLSVINLGERKGARQAFAKVETAVQTWINARSEGGAPSGNSLRDGNGTLAAWRHVTPIEHEPKMRTRKTWVSAGALTFSISGLDGSP